MREGEAQKDYINIFTSIEDTSILTYIICDNTAILCERAYFIYILSYDNT